MTYMKHSMIIASAAFALFVLGSCSTSKPVELNTLAGKWNIVDVNGKPLAVTAADETPYVGFDVVNGSISGFAGCNRIMASFATNLPAGELEMSKVASTRMACPDMAAEQSVIEALNSVKGYKQGKDGRIELISSDGKSVITLEKAKNEISAADLNGTWKITDLDGATDKLTATGEDEASVSFDAAARTYAFTTGCNNISGQFTSSYTDFSFEPGAATMMACPDMTVEDAVKAVLPKVKSFGLVDDGSYAFYNADGDILMIISKK